jgi:hypothetical protein
VLILAQVLGEEYGEKLSHVLWSVYAELIYYGLYPFVLPIIFRFGMGRVLLVSLAISLGMLLLKPDAIYLWEFGHQLNWLFCAPLWLMGCYLAENRQRITGMTRRLPIWGLRLGAVAYCYVSTVLSAHLDHISIGYTWTIWIFGLFCMVWLAAEIARARALQRSAGWNASVLPDTASIWSTPGAHRCQVAPWLAPSVHLLDRRAGSHRWRRLCLLPPCRMAVPSTGPAARTAAHHRSEHRVTAPE